MEDSIATLSAMIPPCNLTYGIPPGGTIEQWFLTNLNGVFQEKGVLNGWIDASVRNKTLAPGSAFYIEEVLDVSGWGLQDLSFFPIQAGIQEGCEFRYIIDDTLDVIDMITDCPLDALDFIENNLLQYPFTMPGLYARRNSNLDATNPVLGWENVLYGQLRTMQHNSNLIGTTVLPVNINDFGSMNPTATDKLYFYRILLPRKGTTVQVGGFSASPASRFIIKGQLKSEGELSYVYRLIDSFKVTQTDVGFRGL
jgi:hypothetical protein|tara:strand:+ start:1344 stop:2105 length:762 start_codon:yes stop_codon:yes gene_type:complete